MYDDHIPYSSEGPDALGIQQSMVSGNPPWDMFHNDPDTWCMDPSPPGPAINAFGQVVPLFSPWHMPGIEEAHNTIKLPDNGAAQAMQHQFGCNPIGLCTSNTHSQSDYSLPTITTPSEWSTYVGADEALYNLNWIPHCGVDDHPIQAQSGWVEDTTPTWYHHPSFTCDRPYQQATSGFEPVPTAYCTFNGAPLNPEIDFSSDPPFNQASWGSEPMAAAYWDYEASSMTSSGVDWDMNTTATDLYSSGIGATYMDQVDWFGVSGLDGLVSQHGGNTGGDTFGSFV
ncbi:hypothetical protein C2E23DRAFT_516420 [Lenzites betulinus]|nr:hypothetical protein C2E23DRAFT_516420 [Lenzites betulinus]